MLTRADELKAEIAKKEVAIADAELEIERKQKAISALRTHQDNLYTSRMRLQIQLKREEARLVKPCGPCVTVTDNNGVEWDI